MTDPNHPAADPALLDHLEARGLIAQKSDDAIAEHLARGAVTVYTGFDPTADSLHLGHMIPLMALAHFQRAGHRVLPLVGGATGMIGDPSGRSDERNLLTLDEVRHNVACIKEQMAQFFTFEGDNPATMVNNYDWTEKMSFIDWLRDVGKHFPLGYMLGKESVRSRLGSERGISYTEFSYMTLQAYDFLHLHRTYGCTLQAGGNDQWGNITAGIDLVRRCEGAGVFGVTYPLLARADGQKFGKTAGGAVWLDPNRTSPFKFYQYWIQCDDRDVEKFLKFFTFLSLEEIAAIVAAHGAAPEKRGGQKRLAEEVTRQVHGQGALDKALKATGILYGGEVAGLSDAELGEIFEDVPSSDLARGFLSEGKTLVDLLAESGAAASKGEARRLLKQGGVYINNRRADDATPIDEGVLASQTVCVLRMGKKRYHLVRFV